MLRSFLSRCFILISVGWIAQPTLAQVIPDTSLGAEQTTLLPTNIVEGGARRGANLFHSFSNFNINSGQRIDFANPAGVDRILTRVTGNSRSEILGTLGVLGNADFFLINPNGILFGPDARLEMRGSFVASSAEAIVFPNQISFSASNPQTPPLLTVSVPLGLQFGANPRNLMMQGTGHNLTYRPDTDTQRVDSPGLQVGFGQTLALIGGDLELQGGSLRAESGQIALGSVAQSGLVRLSATSKGYEFDYAGIDQFGTTELRDRSVADVSGVTGGAIQVQGGRVTLRSGFALLSITQGDGRGGTLSINATESLDLLGDSTDRPQPYASSITSESQGAGVAGDIMINTRRLTMLDGGLVTTYNFGGGGGNITVHAVESVDLIGKGFQDSGLYAGTLSAGDSGNISVTTDRLLVDSSALFTSTYGDGDGGNLTVTARSITVLNTQVESSTFAGGNAGNLILRATDFIELRGTPDPTGDNPGGLFAQTNFPATGNGAQMLVETGRLSMSDGSGIQVATFGEGDAGSLIIRAREIELFNSPGFQNQFDPSITSINAGSKTDMNVPVPPSGDGGNLEIYTDRLSLRNNTRISNFSLGTGQAGDLLISARLIELDDRSTITTETRSTNGGDITIQNATLILLRNGSTITTTAGTANAGGNGGNITINSQFIVSVLTENNDIRANAFTGNGGKINITTQGIFGIRFQPFETPNSDITASSQFGLSGIVTLNTPDLDPTRGTVALPITFSTPPLAQGCDAQNSQTSSFVNTGRGGVPANPIDPLTANTLWQDLEPLPEDTQNSTVIQHDRSETAFENSSASSAPEIIEAQSLTRLPGGTISLMAQVPSELRWHSSLVTCPLPMTNNQ
ncbi:MAG: S-layer family protein [Oculatellaceae cyanobacterium bins.114]|nr:S-layer family protein [Oculatellaceae cyanobacterium bins.114]